MDETPASAELARVATSLATLLGVRRELAHIETGDPARRLAARAAELNAGLIVVGTRSHDDRVDPRLGSVSSRLAADAPCPVLVVPYRLLPHVDPSSWPGRTIVAGYDDSDAGHHAALAALDLARRLDSPLRLVSVETAVDWRLDEVAARLGHDTGLVDSEVRGGDPAWELERVARAITAPLIAVGSRGLGPERRPLLGAVTEQVLRTARRPVLVSPSTLHDAS